MVICFGKYMGEPAESVVLKHPDYVAWVLAQTSVTGDFARLAKEFRRLIELFDGLPVARCAAVGCERPATRCTLHRGALIPYWWCPSCDPTTGRNPPAQLTRVRTYVEACSYVAMYCNGRRTDAAQLIRSMAQAKGLGARAGEAEVLAFFASVGGE